LSDFRAETGSLGEVSVPADRLWGAQTQRSLEHFSLGKDLILREMITAYAILKKAASNANHAGKRFGDDAHALIVKVCDEILAGKPPEEATVYGDPVPSWNVEPVLVDYFDLLRLAAMGVS
jgi:fumarate hydratase, class II